MAGACGGSESGQTNDGGVLGPDGAPEECTPLTCESLGYNCGSSDDGCGGTLSCGTCDAETEECRAGSCRQTVCFEGEPNVCGGCESLEGNIGDSCHCGGTAECAETDITCDDGNGDREAPIDLGATDDGQDEWRSFTGNLETTLTSFDAEAKWNHWDQDWYKLYVEDTILGDKEPEFEYVHPGGYEVRVCVLEHDDNSLAAGCEGGNLTGGSAYWLDDGTILQGCCEEFGTGDVDTHTIALRDHSVPLLDDSALYYIMIEGRGTPSCSEYEFRYSF